MSNVRPKAAPMAIGSVNILVIDPDMVIVEMQIDLDKEETQNDEVTLTRDQGGYEKTILLGSLSEFDVDWVRLEFYDTPTDGTYSLVHDPKDDLIPYKIFTEVPFEDLRKIDPKPAALVVVDDPFDREENPVDEDDGAAVAGGSTIADSPEPQLTAAEAIKDMEITHTSKQVASPEEVAGQYLGITTDEAKKYMELPAAKADAYLEKLQEKANLPQWRKDIAEMEITHTAKQVASAEEVAGQYLGIATDEAKKYMELPAAKAGAYLEEVQEKANVPQWRKDLAKMEITYTSKQVGSVEDVVGEYLGVSTAEATKYLEMPDLDGEKYLDKIRSEGKFGDDVPAVPISRVEVLSTVVGVLGGKKMEKIGDALKTGAALKATGDDLADTFKSIRGKK